MARKKAPEDLVNEMFSEPDLLRLSDRKIVYQTTGYNLRGIPRNLSAEGRAAILAAANKPKSEAHKAKLRKPKSEAHKANLKGRVVSDETKILIRMARSKQTMPKRDPLLVAQSVKLHTGKKRSELSKAKMREAHKTRVWPVMTCPNCGHTARAIPNFHRYHMNNCKLKKPNTKKVKPCT